MKVSVAEYNISNLDEEVILSGWISKKRNLGGLFFIDLRDRSGIIQLNINNECKDYELVSKLKTLVVSKIGKKSVNFDLNISDNVNSIFS